MHRTDRDLYDALHDAMNLAHLSRADKVGIVGYGVAHLWEGDPRDGTKLIVPFGNLITDAGDLYCAGKIITLIAPANAAAPTAANGMKLGTASTAVTKTDAGLGTYLSASNVAFDASFPATVNLGSTLGVNAQYKTTWGAGIATSATIQEVAIVNDQATNADTTAPNTYSHAVFTLINKAAGDSLAITYNWKALGA